MSFFEVFVEGGGALILIIISGILLAVQALFAFLIWRKGDAKYFMKFLYLTLAAVAALLGGAFLMSILMGIGGSEFTLTFSSGVLAIAGIGAVGIAIFLFIRDTWISKEDE